MTKKGMVGVGIIGTGFARTTQLPAFRACEGARLVAVASGRRENAERVAREFGIPSVASDWREVIAHPEVHLVSIVTPPSTHAEMTLAALEAGRAVLCEKPTAMNADESRRMREAASSSGLFAHLDHELRFLPARRLMREMIAAGEVGRVRHARLLFRSDSRASAERGWDWWSDAEAGGGVLGAIGSHAVDSLRWLLASEVSHVSASLATHVAERTDPQTNQPRRVTTDDEATLLLHFTETDTVGRATASVSLSVVEAGPHEHSVEVYGSEGALRVDQNGRLLRARVGEGAWREVEVEDEAPLAEGLRDSEWSRGFTLFAREIVAALAAGRRAVEGAATFDDGHRIQLVLDAARAAHEGGCRVTVAD
ncbi:MAG TPA: Gfo/Idh/MocA family oxidoreductase [Pyrinomonadaceae bacterium]|nr:Gfo/Idh/MocA family oxidoreductase [Pyrinomonadaceae bacterium]